MSVKVINPLTKLDYPDPDIIRVGDTYYMVSTTMHFMPGCEILRSYDLANWEHISYVYDRLDSTDGQKLCGANIYGKGMWAASLRYHNGRFYVCFVANDTGKTYIFTSESIEGPWEKRCIKGFYHDCSLLFDDDDRVYIAYGNRVIRITELKMDLSEPLEGGLNRVAVVDPGKHNLGYEGSHFYKINGKYYLFFIHSLEDRWMRTEACFIADSIDGEFVGGDVLVDDMGYCGQGVAQGGIVDTPDGKWYAVLFQDSGAVGRIPVLVPVSWQGSHPVFGVDRKVPRIYEADHSIQPHEYEPLVRSDDFKVPTDLDQAEYRRLYGCFDLKSVWQFNHEPDTELIWHDSENGEYGIITGLVCDDVTKAKNTLTQRMIYPGCSGEVTVDISRLNEGDYAGICAFQSCYSFAAATKRDGKNYIVMKSAAPDGRDIKVRELDAVLIEGNEIKLRVDVDFTEMKDEAQFFYHDGSNWKKLGETHKMYYRLDHFTGYRFGLFMYSSKEAGGRAGFRNFIYKH